jgi:hypothetical protein
VRDLDFAHRVDAQQILGACRDAPDLPSMAHSIMRLSGGSSLTMSTVCVGVTTSAKLRTCSWISLEAEVKPGPQSPMP